MGKGVQPATGAWGLARGYITEKNDFSQHPSRVIANLWAPPICTTMLTGLDLCRPNAGSPSCELMIAMATSFPKDSSSINLAPAYLRAQPSEMTIATMRDHRHQPIHNCKEAEFPRVNWEWKTLKTGNRIVNICWKMGNFTLIEFFSKRFNFSQKRAISLNSSASSYVLKSLNTPNTIIFWANHIIQNTFLSFKA